MRWNYNFFVDLNYNMFLLKHFRFPRVSCCTFKLQYVLIKTALVLGMRRAEMIFKLQYVLIKTDFIPAENLSRRTFKLQYAIIKSFGKYTP